MKILTVMYTLKRGGAYDRFRMMVEAFLERRWEVHCLSLTPIPFNNPFYQNHLFVIPFQKGMGWMVKLWILLLFPLHSFWIGWRKKIDLFIAFGGLYAFILAIPKWVLKKPMVTLIRGDSTFGLKVRSSPKIILWLNRFIEYFGISFSDRILTVNKAIQEEMTRLIRRKKEIEVEILPNNILSTTIPVQKDISQIRTKFGIPREAKILITAGIINRGKNIERLIRCLPRIGINNLFLVIVGEGSTKADFQYDKDLKKLAEHLGLIKQVIFLGWLKKEDLLEIFSMSDLFVLPSKNEGMPNAMLEALGVDLPCMGSNIPGIKDILQHDELMFNPLGEDDISEKILHFFSDDSFYQKVRRSCQERKVALTFDWKGKIFEIATKEISYEN